MIFYVAPMKNIPGSQLHWPGQQDVIYDVGGAVPPLTTGAPLVFEHFPMLRIEGRMPKNLCDKIVLSNYSAHVDYITIT